VRLVTLDCREVGGRPAVQVDRDLLDLTVAVEGLDAAQWRPQSVVSVLAEGELGLARVRTLVHEVQAAPEERRRAWRETGRLVPVNGTQLLPPVRRPGLLLMAPRGTTPDDLVYVKNPNAAVGPDAEVRLPAARFAQLHGVPMLGWVLGKPLSRAGREEAIHAVAAVTLVADLGTAELGGGPRARQFAGACVVGPALVTREDFVAGTSPGLAVQINGYRVTRDPVGPSLDEVGAAVAELSIEHAFRPGDIIALGRGGAGFRVAPGDRVTISADALLTLNFGVGACPGDR
jgi:hypothetical protein